MFVYLNSTLTVKIGYDFLTQNIFIFIAFAYCNMAITVSIIHHPIFHFAAVLPYISVPSLELYMTKSKCSLKESKSCDVANGSKSQRSEQDNAIRR